MNAPTAPESGPTPIYAQPNAIRLAFALLVGLTLLLGLAFMDRSQRAQLETTAEVTAVGDLALAKLPAEAAQFPAVAATLAGQSLYALSPEKLSLRDTHMVKVGTDATRGLTVYTLGAAATAEEQQRATKEGTGYFLKLAPNEFAKVSVSSAR